MTQPLVSIITPVYNGEKYLEETLLSVFSQTYKHWELIVIDDGSATDACAKICQKYSDKMKYLRQDNRGLSAARNRGIQEAKGEYIAFIDQDDIWLPQKLEKQVAYYLNLREQGKNTGLIFTWLQNISATGEKISQVCYECGGKNYDVLVFADFVGTPSSVLLPRSVLEDVGVFDENIKGNSDWDLWLRISRKYEMYSLNELLTQYRFNGGSLSTNTPLMIKDTFTVVEKVLKAEENVKSLDEETVKAVREYHDKQAGISWKTFAYQNLFTEVPDAVNFRKYMAFAAQYDPALFDWKVRIYQALSYVSPGLCGWIKSLSGKKPGTDHAFWNGDVRHIKRVILKKEA